MNILTFVCFSSVALSLVLVELMFLTNRTILPSGDRLLSSSIFFALLNYCDLVFTHHPDAWYNHVHFCREVCLDFN